MAAWETVHERPRDYILAVCFRERKHDILAVHCSVLRIWCHGATMHGILVHAWRWAACMEAGMPLEHEKVLRWLTARIKV